MAHERCELLGTAEQLRERHSRSQALLRLLGQRHQHRRVEDAGRDRVGANAELRKLARRRHGERGDASFGGRVGGLADLALEGRDRGGRHDDAALAVGERGKALHVGGDEPHHVEGADQVDLDHPLEIGQRHGAVATDDALGRPHARTVDEDARHAVRRARLTQRGDGCVGAGHVTADGNATDLLRHRLGAVEIDVEAGDLGARRRQLRRGRGPKPRSAAGDDGGVSLDIHNQSLRDQWLRVEPVGAASGFSIKSAMP